VFIDLQLKLQCPDGIYEWDKFYSCLVGRLVQRHLDTPGVKTIVCAYDDYQFSPAAKGPTQTRRINRTAVTEWQAHRPLPPNIPANYNSLLFNRTFKAQVVKYLITQITLQCRVHDGQRLIIDHTGRPYVALGVGSGKAAGELGENSPEEPALEFEVACGLGECDVKWVRYLPWGNLLLEAVDGDFIIIAMSQIERLGHAAPNIYVRRLHLDPSNAVKAAVSGIGPKKTGRGKKRALDSGDADEPTSALDTGNEGSTDPNKVVKAGGRVYEYAHCNLIVDGIRSTFGSKTTDVLKKHTIQLLSHAVAHIGCDFCHGIPYFNGNVLFKNLKLLWPGYCDAATVDPTTGIVSLDARVIADKVVGKLWTDVQFEKQCSSVRNASFETIYNFLKNNDAISAFRRERLISPNDLCALVRGSNWTSWYWFSPETCPCALKNNGEFGFVKVKNRVQVDNNRPLPVGTKQPPAGKKTTMTVLKNWFS
jgi:hypothetical protein